MTEDVWLAVIGLAAGLLGGLLGIGGSIVMIPALTELFGPRQHLYQAAALIVNFFVAAPAVVQHVRAMAVDVSVLRGLIPGAVVGAVAGVACSELSLFSGTGSLYLTGAFGCFLFYAAGADICSAFSRGPQGDGRRGTDAAVREVRPLRVALLVGLPTGILSGLLGVGGGVLAVPLQRRVFGIEVRSAIANSAAMIVALSLVGGGMKNAAIAIHHPDLTWWQPARLALYLIPMAIVGSFIGARLTHMLPTRGLRGAFALVLLVAGGRMVMRAYGG